MLCVLVAVLATACGEADTSRKHRSNEAAAKADAPNEMTVEDIKVCLNAGGQVVQGAEALECVGDGGSQDAHAVVQPCKVVEVPEGVLIACGAQDPLLVRHGQNGASCVTRPVESGVAIQCCDADALIVHHGEDRDD